MKADYYGRRGHPILTFLKTNQNLQCLRFALLFPGNAYGDLKYNPLQRLSANNAAELKNLDKHVYTTSDMEAQ